MPTPLEPHAELQRPADLEAEQELEIAPDAADERAAVEAGDVDHGEGAEIERQGADAIGPGGAAERRVDDVDAAAEAKAIEDALDRRTEPEARGGQAVGGAPVLEPDLAVDGDVTDLPAKAPWIAPA